MIDGFKPYPTMKDSGVEWLGQVPAHWDLRRTKSLLTERSDKGHPDQPLLAATQSKGVVRKEQYENRTVLALKDLQLLKRVLPGDFVISLRSFQGGIEFARSEGIISPAYTILYPVESAHHAFLSKVFKSRFYIDNLSQCVTGIRQGQNIDYERLARSYLPLPPLSEQSDIVRVLDHADRRIGRYVRAKEKLIALLEEQKQAIIHQAVTGRIDVRTGQPYPDYKPSGMEWLGYIPTHWQVLRNGRLFAQRNEIGFPGLPILEVSLRTGVRVRDFENSDRKQVMSDRNMYKRAVKGDIAYNMMRMWQGAVGTTPIDGLVSPAYVVAKPLAGMEPRYFSALFRTGAYMSEVDKFSRGIVKDRNRLYWEDFKQMPTPCPQPSEQIFIADAIEHGVATLDERIRLTERQIDLIRELRTRLIADVVTGKFDVRDAAAALAKEPDGRDAAWGDCTGPEGGDEGRTDHYRRTEFPTAQEEMIA